MTVSMTFTTVRRMVPLTAEVLYPTVRLPLSSLTQAAHEKVTPSPLLIVLENEVPPIVNVPRGHPAECVCPPRRSRFFLGWRRSKLWHRCSKNKFYRTTQRSPITVCGMNRKGCLITLFYINRLPLKTGGKLNF